MRFVLWAIALSCAAQTSTLSIEQVRENALDYVKRLPDFLCQEVVSRYSKPAYDDVWRPLDTVTAQLTYFRGQEEYTQIRVNNKPIPGSGLNSLDGSMGQGEFGSLMRTIFDPESQALFAPKGRGKVHGRRVSVFKFDVHRDRSEYRISSAGNPDCKPAYRGEISVDDETLMVMRVEMATYGIPKDYPVQSVSTTVDYKLTKVGGKEYLLPVLVQVVADQRYLLTRNVEAFKEYRKFGTETNLTFDTPETPAH